MNINELKTKKDWALFYQSIGLNIIPVGANKISLIKWEVYQNKRSTVEEINGWWEQWPDANIAVVTGKISGIVALDLDLKYGRTSKEFQIPLTACARSGGGGEHFFFKYPTNSDIRSGSAISGLGVDIRAEGGYILLSPSVNDTGGLYEWIVPFESKDDLAQRPAWLRKAISNDSNEKKWLSGKDGVSEGSRNEIMASFIGKILHDLSPELWNTAGWDSVVAQNKRNTPPLIENELKSIWESIKKYHTDDMQKETKDNSLLNEICNREDVILFHDEQKDAYIALDISGHQEIWPCKGKSMKRLIASKSWEKNKKPLSSESIKSIVGVLEGKGCFEGKQIKLHNRVAWYNNDLWLDLTNEKWQTIKINKNGWEIIDKSPIIFKRYNHSQSQVIPTKNGDVKLFLNYINVTNQEHKLLLLVFLVSCFIPDFPHTLLVVFGAQGSSKTTLSKLTRLVADPSIIDVVALPDSQRELVQILAHHHFLFFDNVSHVSEDGSDTICKAITGSGFSKRELYENDEDIIYKFQRCIGINGINLVTIRPDLLERSLLIELERIDKEKRKQEKEIYTNFTKDLPYILGGVLDVLTRAIEIKPRLNVSNLPRMADWANWGCAISEALGYTKEEFLKAYENNINRQAEMLLNENIVATTLFLFMEDKLEWKGTATELLQRLYEKTSMDYFEKQEKFWPKSAGSLSRRLNELSTYLKQIGILVTINTTGQERYIQITKTSETKKEIKQPLLTDDTYGTDDK